MQDQYQNLLNILQKEVILFSQLYQLEKEKSTAIINIDGKILESISSKQEALLKTIGPLESLRTNIISKYRKTTNNNYMVTSLKSLTEDMNDDSAANIIQCGKKLRNILKKTKSIQNTNHQMMNDNLKYFNISINKLKGELRFLYLIIKVSFSLLSSKA